MNSWEALERTAKFIDFINKLPKMELITGIIVPILSVCVSYKLVRRSSRKEESNILNIEIELVLRELVSNLKSIGEFIDLNSEYKKLKENIEIKMPFSQDILYNVLFKIKNISDNYFYSGGNYIFEKPNCLYIDYEKIEDIDKEIEKAESNFCSNPILEQKKQTRIAQLQESKEQIIEDLKKIRIGIFIKNL